MKLTIDRQKWLRGEGTFRSRLLRESDGKQCCIGFLCEAVGISREMIRDQRVVLDLELSSDFQIPLWMRDLWVSINDPKPDILKAYTINDDETLSDNERENQISALFASHDIQVEFTN